jgi:hypothetical protein
MTRLRSVMSLGLPAILASWLLGSCVATPHELCSAIVPSDWRYVGADQSLDGLLGANLPNAPYETSDGSPVHAVRHIWYRNGENALLACTLAIRSRDNCSVRVTEFARKNDMWSKGRDNAVLCNVVGR